MMRWTTMLNLLSRSVELRLNDFSLKMMLLSLSLLLGTIYSNVENHFHCWNHWLRKEMFEFSMMLNPVELKWLMTTNSMIVDDWKRMFSMLNNFHLGLSISPQLVIVTPLVETIFLLLMWLNESKGMCLNFSSNCLHEDRLKSMKIEFVRHEKSFESIYKVKVFWQWIMDWPYSALKSLGPEVSDAERKTKENKTHWRSWKGDCLSNARTNFKPE